ncbi:MAG: hypothetical protein AB1705_26045 [Verrucomicrobiota bacterium]
MKRFIHILRSNRLVITATALLITLFFVFAFRQPRHDGQPLSHWVNQLYPYYFPQNQTNYDRAVDALRAIGPQAVPHLIAQVETDQRWLDQTLVGVGSHWSPARTTLSVRRQSRLRAVRALAELGPLATNAVPTLQHVSRQKNYLSHEADAALLRINAASLQPLCDTIATANPASGDWNQALNTLRALGPSAAPALPDLLPLLQHTNQSVRLRTLDLLRYIRGDAQLAAPPLLRCLTDTNSSIRTSALYTLDSTYPDAVRFHPDLIAAGLRDTNEVMRANAIRALRHVSQPQKPDYLADAIQMLNSNPSAQSSAMLFLKSMGPAARPALPDLQKIATNTLARTGIRRAALDTITAITNAP